MAIFNEQYILEQNVNNYKRYGYIDKFGTYNAVIEIDGKKYRERSEVICFSKDHKKVFVGLDDHDKYSIPGGGLDPKENPVKTASRELKEEAFIVGSNFKFCENYITLYSKTPQWLIDNIPEKEWWIGNYNHLYICDFSKYFNGKVDEKDRDVLYDTGKFISIKDAIEVLNDIQKKYLR